MGIFYKESADYAICQPETFDTEEGITRVTRPISRLRFRKPTFIGRLLNRQPHAQLTEGLIRKDVVWKAGLISPTYPYRQEYTPVSTKWSLARRKPPERLTEREGILILEGSKRKGSQVLIVRNLPEEEQRRVILVR